MFIRVGDRVRYIGELKGHSGSWPEGVWLEKGNEGTVTEYHPLLPEVVVAGERFEAIPAYAVVTFDNGASRAIDPEDEGERWERVKQPIHAGKDLRWWTITELKAACRRKGLSVSGNKEDLIRRLK